MSRFKTAAEMSEAVANVTGEVQAVTGVCGEGLADLSGWRWKAGWLLAAAAGVCRFRDATGLPSGLSGMLSLPVCLFSVGLLVLCFVLMVSRGCAAAPAAELQDCGAQRRRRLREKQGVQETGRAGARESGCVGQLSARGYSRAGYGKRGRIWFCVLAVVLLCGYSAVLSH